MKCPDFRSADWAKIRRDPGRALRQVIVGWRRARARRKSGLRRENANPKNRVHMRLRGTFRMRVFGPEPVSNAEGVTNLGDSALRKESPSILWPG